MSAPLEFVFRIFDSMSGPASKITGALDKTTGALTNASKATDKLNDSAKSGSAGAESFFGKFLVGGAVLGAATAIVGTLISKIIDLGREFIETAAHAESMGLAFKLNMGTEGAEKIDRYLSIISSKTGVVKSKLQEMVLPLVQKGLGAEDITKFLPAAFDAKAKGLDPASALKALGTIKTNKTLDLGSLEALGIGKYDDQRKLLMDLLKRSGGMATSRATNAELASVISERMQRGYGKLRPEEAINRALSAAAGAGPSGAAGETGAGTVTSLLDRIENLKATWITSLTDPSKLGPLKDVLNKFLDTFDPASAAGKQFAGVLTDVIDGFLSLSKWVAKNWDDIVFWGKVLAVSLGTVVGILTAALAIIGAAIVLVGIVIASVVYQIVDFFQGLAALGGYIGDALGSATAQVAEWIQGLIDWITTVPAKIASKAMSIGTAIVTGIRDGITNGIGMVKDAVSNLGNSAITGLKGLLGIASPSKVFASMGRYSSMGFAEGIMSGGSLVDGAIGSTFGVDASGSSTMGSGSGSVARAGGGMSVGSISLTVQVDGAGATDPQALADKIKEILPGALVHAFEQVATQQGVY